MGRWEIGGCEIEGKGKNEKGRPYASTTYYCAPMGSPDAENLPVDKNGYPRIIRRRPNNTNFGQPNAADHTHRKVAPMEFRNARRTCGVDPEGARRASARNAPAWARL